MNGSEPSPEQKAADDAKAFADEKVKQANEAASQAVNLKFRAQQERELAVNARDACEAFPNVALNSDYDAGNTELDGGDTRYAEGQSRWVLASQYYSNGSEAYMAAQTAYNNREWQLAESLWTVAASNFGYATDKSNAAGTWFLLANYSYQRAAEHFQSALLTLQMP